jgi:uncharacterized protein
MKKISQEYSSEKFSDNYSNLFEKLKENRAYHADVDVFTEEAFDHIDCLTCANCCKSAPPIFLPQDIKRLALHLSVSKKEFIKRYLILDVDNSYTGKTVPCPFLLADNKCSVYEHRPEACRAYPHLHSKSFTRLSKYHIRNVSMCPITERVLDNMNQLLNDNI